MPGPRWRGGRKWVNVLSPWPGRGRWRFLPPWLRPGWVFGGRRRCWTYLYLLYYHPHLISYFMTWGWLPYLVPPYYVPVY
ncbi:MAG TPA: hypothetical protein EYP08_01435 [Pyrodictiaceae archaeon]|nr:hypothetical protein [Pyrodictiaceae archaeon]